MDKRPPAKIGFFASLLIKLAGADEATLQECPQQDVSAIIAVAALLAATGIYSAAVFSAISHRLFSEPGHFNPGLIAISIAIAAFIVAIDSYVFLRCSHFAAGILELKRAGLDISSGEGRVTTIKNNIFLGVRVGLSLCLAMLTGTCVSMIVFDQDISARLDHNYRQANAALFRDATDLVDTEIHGTTDAVTAQAAQVVTLSAQINVLRQNQIAAPADVPETQHAEQEVDLLLTEKAKADDAVRKAETFASFELGGLKSASNSGHPGSGPRYRAAQEDVANARHHAQEVNAALTAARGRLDDLRFRLATADAATRQKSRDQLPTFEGKLEAENGKLASLKTQLAELTRGRNDAIRSMVDQSPNHVRYNDGFLARIVALGQFAGENGKVATSIVLFELVSIGLELALVLAKTLVYCPTAYSALIARDHYMHVFQIVDDMMKKPRGDKTGSVPSDAPKPPPPANDNEPDGGNVIDPFGMGNNSHTPPVDPPPPPAPRRGRGRPKKPRLH